MADKTLGIAVKGKDELSPVVRGIRNTMEGFKRDAATGFGLGAGISVFNMAQRALGTVVDVMGDAVGAASDFVESESKVGAVFTTQADTVKQWAADLDASYGITEQAALEAAGTLGNFLQSMGSTEEQAADFSTSLTELAGDLSSFNNVDVGEVFLALRSGLAGETEPMRRFGVDLSAAAVEARILRDGLAKTKAEITQSMKVQARYNIIMEKTGAAHGDAARTSDTLAGQQRRLGKVMGDAMADVGRALLPVAAELTKIAADVIPAVIDAVGDLGGAIDSLLDDINAAATGQVRMSTTAQLVADEFGVEVDALIEMTNEMRRQEQAAAAARVVQEELGRALPIDTLDSAALSTEWLGEETKDAVTATREMTGEEKELRAAAERLHLVESTLAVSMGRRQAMADRLGDSARTQTTEEKRLSDALVATSDAMSSIVPIAVDAADKVAAVAAERKRVELLADAIEHVADVSFRDVADAAQETQQAIKDAFSDPIPTIQKLRQEEEQLAQQRRRAMREGRFDIVAMIDQRQAEIDQEIAQRQMVNQHYRAEREEQEQRRADLQKLITRFGLTTDAARELYVQAGKDITVAIDTARAHEKLDRLRERLAAIPDETVYVEIMERGGRAGGGGGTGRAYETRAQGGPVAPGGAYLVGEHGPEVLKMGSSGGTVIPNHRLDGGGGNVYLDGYLVGRILDERLGRQYGTASRVSNYRRSN